MKAALNKYNTGQPDPGAENLEVYCDETEWLFERKLDGMNFTDRKTPSFVSARELDSLTMSGLSEYKNVGNRELCHRYLNRTNKN
jgi:hypothetical protein